MTIVNHPNIICSDDEINSIDDVAGILREIAYCPSDEEMHNIYHYIEKQMTATNEKDNFILDTLAGCIKPQNYRDVFISIIDFIEAIPYRGEEKE